MYDIEFGNRLKDLRDAKSTRMGRKLTQEVVARELGIKTGTYASWESGRNKPRVNDLPDIADYFQVSIDYLLGRAEGIQPRREVYASETGLCWSLRRKPNTPNEQKGIEIWRCLAEGAGLEAIKREFQIDSRDMSRYLRDAVYAELIDVDIERLPFEPELAERVREHFRVSHGVKLVDFKVVRTPLKALSEEFRTPASTFGTILLGEAARRYFLEQVQSRMIRTVGIAGGFTISRMVYALRRGECRGLDIFPLATSPVIEAIDIDANTLVGVFAYRHYGYGVRGHALQYADSQDLRQTENPWRFAPTMSILARARSVEMAFMGLGSLERQRLPISWLDDLLRSKGLSMEGIRRDNPVGDVLYHLVDSEGNEVGREINDLICSISLEDLKALVQMGCKVVAVAAGKQKTAVTRAAIKARYANVLIIDDELAEGLLEPEARQS